MFISESKVSIEQHVLYDWHGLAMMTITFSLSETLFVTTYVLAQIRLGFSGQIGLRARLVHAPARGRSPASPLPRVALDPMRRPGSSTVVIDRVRYCCCHMLAGWEHGSRSSREGRELWTILGS